MSAGYSKRTLIQKLGIKAGNRLALINAPDNYEETLGPLPAGVTALDTLDESLDFIQFFTKEASQLEAQFPSLKAAMTKSGMIWISWPKKASKVETDITEDVIRQIGLEIGLVDVKVCAVDHIWSGLKFMYRLKDR